MKDIQTYRQILEDIQSRLGSARLMAVSKLHTLEEVMAVYQAGARLFGENHVQEIAAKFGNGKPEDMEVHMIGHLQSNKVGKVVPLVDMIESVDSLSLMQKISNAAQRIGKVMAILIEYNTSNEQAKSGFCTREDLYQAIEASKAMEGIRIRGLMTVGPVDCDPAQKDELTDKAFRELADIRKECQELYPELDFGILSMGMSGDYLIALKNGSTQVRIGTAIFGERDYSK